MGNNIDSDEVNPPLALHHGKVNSRKQIHSIHLQSETVCILAYPVILHVLITLLMLTEAANHEKDILLLNQGLAVLRMPVDPRGGRSYIIHFEAFMTAVGESRQSSYLFTLFF